MRKLLLVDDHPLFREGLRWALGRTGDNVLLTCVATAHEALAALTKNPDFDLCLVDRKLGEDDGVELAIELRRRHGVLAVAVVASEPDPIASGMILRAGGLGYLLKSRDAEAMKAAIDEMFEGRTVFDVQPATGRTREALPLRQSEVLRFAARGLLDKQIGQKLDISENTVRHHWKRIFDRLGVANRVEAVSKALSSGSLADPPTPGSTRR